MQKKTLEVTTQLARVHIIVVVLASRQINASASARLIQGFICLKSLTAYDEFVQGKKKALGIR